MSNAAQKSIRHYIAVIGTEELHFSSTSDTRAVKLAARWVRLCWSKKRTSAPSWSIAHAINNAPDIMCQVGRYSWHPLCAKGVRGDKVAVIRTFAPEAAKVQ